MSHRLLLLLVMLCAACAGTPTPFPVNVTIAPTAMPQSAAEATAAPGNPTDALPVRYALAANVRGGPINAESFGSGARVTQLEDAGDPLAVGTDYDVLVTYGDLPGWTQSPVSHHLLLILNTTIAPLADAQVLSAVQPALGPQWVDVLLGTTSGTSDTFNVAQLNLANAGYPDGIELVLAHSAVPGIALFMAQLKDAGVIARALPLFQTAQASDFDPHTVQLTLVLWGNETEREQWVQRAAGLTILDWGMLPISYLTASGLQITINDLGLPVATR